jgi:5-methylcytosine-specific restriction endonuclease McrA
MPKKAIDLSKFSAEQLRRALAEKEKSGKKPKAKAQASKPVKKQTATLKPRTAKEKRKYVKSRVEESDRRKVDKFKAALALKRRKKDEEMKEAGRLAPKGKYVRQMNYAIITLKYKVHVYEGGKKIGDYPGEVSEPVKIIWNQNRAATWVNKLREAQNALVDRVQKTMESGSIMQESESKFSTRIVENKRELRQYVSDPRKLGMLGVAAYDDVQVGRKIIEYKFIPADVNIPKKGFICTDSYLIDAYKPQIPTLCQEKLDGIMGKVDPKRGRSCEDLDKFCTHYKISHYALDFKHYLFWKEVRNRRYKALMYYCVNGHLYPVTDDKTRESIVKKSSARDSKSTHGTNLKASLSEKKEEEQVEETNKRFEMDFHEDVSVRRLEKYHDCNIFYHTHSLYKMLVELYSRYGKAYEGKYTADKLTCIIIPERNLRLYANMNHRTVNPLKKGDDGKRVPYDWNDVKEECEAMNVPFTNQSLTQLSKHIHARFDLKGKKKHMRVATTKEQRLAIRLEQGTRCATCNCHMDLETFEIDHILSLSQGGDNSRANLQALCKKCHKTKSNKEAAERCFDTDNTQSDYNAATLEIFKTVKNGFIHNFDPVDRHWQARIEQGKSYALGFDICKCRTETALRMESDWCVFSIFDDVVSFDDRVQMVGGKLKPGVYRVVTNNYLPFKGTGWYMYNLVQKALARGLITVKDISHCVIASFTLPNNYYAPFITYVRENVKNKNLAKPIINMFIGSMGHKVTKTRKLFLTTSMNEAAYHKFCVTETDNFQVHVVKNKEVDGLIEVMQCRTQYVESNHVPQFNQILDEEAWQLYEIAELLRKHNCRSMIYYNTDNAIAEFANESDVEACKKEGLQVYWDDKKKFPKYKVANDIHNMDRVERDEMRENLVEKLSAGLIDRPFTMEHPKYRNIWVDDGRSDFSELVEQVVLKDQSFQIQGLAGTGKSTFLKKFITFISSIGQTCVSMAPTHKACRSLDQGIQLEDEDVHETKTLDSQWSVIKNGCADMFNRTDWVIVDEKSMIKEGFWKCMLQVLHRAPKCKFVICGDWYQIPPVMDRKEDFDYQHSRALWELSAGNMLEFTKCRRADNRLFSLCKRVVKREKVDLDVFPKAECERSLAYNNSVRKQVNHQWMLQKTKGTGVKYIVVPAVPGKGKLTQDARIYKGMPLIAIETNRSMGIANSDEFTVVKVTDAEVTIAFVLDDETIDASKEKIVVPVDVFPRILQPAYCKTCHRSQCTTIRAPFTVYQSTYMSKAGDFGAKLLYVALSRAADYSLINISHEYDD